MKRREFLAAAALLLPALSVTPAYASFVASSAIQRRPRTISVYHAETSEKLTNVAYWSPDDGYCREALVELSWFARDYHVDEVKLLDPRLFDMLYVVSGLLNTTQPAIVTSGYRTRETNEALRRTIPGVAKNSLHIDAKAIDFYLPGASLRDVRRIAIMLRRGGVGYYPDQKFLHLDTGRIRQWQG